MKTGFVFTNYNNSIYTKQVIQSILSNGGASETFIVIVDNKSDLSDIELLNCIKSEYPAVIIIFNEENVGYFRGLNVGIKYLRDNHNKINHIIIGNNDLIFPDNFLSILSANLEIFEEYAVISPDIVTLDGVHQNPHVLTGVSKLRDHIYNIYYSNYYCSIVISWIAKLTKKFTERKDREQYKIGRPIFSGYGACYILGPLFFSSFNSLWAPTFLMGEEFFLATQLRSKGLGIYYEPRFTVQHYDHATVGKLHSKKFWEIAKESHKIYNFVKFHQVSPAGEFGKEDAQISHLKGN